MQYTIDLVTKTNQDAKITKVKKKIPNFSDFVKDINLNRKVYTAATNLETKSDITVAVDSIIKSRKKIDDLNYFLRKCYFNHHGFQNYLIFQIFFKRL